MSPSDIVDAAIEPGVRVEHVVEIPGAERETLELFARGGTREGATETSPVIAGLDCDGVEWRIAVVPTRGVPVIAPSRTGARPTEQARFARIDDARAYARIYRSMRHWLTWQDIRIGDPLIEYAGTR